MIMTSPSARQLLLVVMQGLGAGMEKAQPTTKGIMHRLPRVIQRNEDLEAGSRAGLTAANDGRLPGGEELTADGQSDALVACLGAGGSEEHTSELQSPLNLVCRLLLEKKKEI